jgi:hypothetical protein
MSHLGVGPWHQRVDVLVEMAVGEPDEDIAQIGIGLDAVRLTGADQTGEAGPITTALEKTSYLVVFRRCVRMVVAFVMIADLANAPACPFFPVGFC